jgi:hypothetical protein
MKIQIFKEQDEEEQIIKLDMRMGEQGTQCAGCLMSFDKFNYLSHSRDGILFSWYNRPGYTREFGIYWTQYPVQLTAMFLNTGSADSCWFAICS